MVSWRTFVALFAASAACAAAANPKPPGAPTVLGPRETESSRPVFTFQAARAVSFRCAFDSTLLHRCAARYSQRLSAGAHVLRVRSVAKSGALSRVVTVHVRVLEPLPRLAVGRAVTVGEGAGVPAPAGAAVWVPTTGDGKLARVAGSSVSSRTPIGPGSAGAEGFLDSAVASGDSVWSASDAGNAVVRVEASTGRVVARIATAPRPGGLTAGGGGIWAFHFLQGTLTRIDEATGARTVREIQGARATGVAYAEGSVWLLTANPARILRIDPSTGVVTRSFDLRPPYPQQRAFIESWWLSYGDGAVWATLPNVDAVARLDVATGAMAYVRLRYGRPFGVAAGGGSAWVATDRAAVRLDSATGKPVGAVTLPLADRAGFVSVAQADGAAWVTNYDRGTVVRITPS